MSCILFNRLYFAEQLDQYPSMWEKKMFSVFFLTYTVFFFWWQCLDFVVCLFCYLYQLFVLMSFLKIVCTAVTDIYVFNVQNTQVSGNVVDLFSSVSDNKIYGVDPRDIQSLHVKLSSHWNQQKAFLPFMSMKSEFHLRGAALSRCSCVPFASMR